MGMARGIFHTDRLQIEDADTKYKYIKGILLDNDTMHIT